MSHKAPEIGEIVHYRAPVFDADGWPEPCRPAIVMRRYPANAELTHVDDRTVGLMILSLPGDGSKHPSEFSTEFNTGMRYSALQMKLSDHKALGFSETWHFIHDCPFKKDTSPIAPKETA